jgi:hypothetical protein
MPPCSFRFCPDTELVLAFRVGLGEVFEVFLEVGAVVGVENQ